MHGGERRLGRLLRKVSSAPKKIENESTTVRILTKNWKSCVVGFAVIVGCSSPIIGSKPLYDLPKRPELPDVDFTSPTAGSVACLDADNVQKMLIYDSRLTTYAQQLEELLKECR